MCVRAHVWGVQTSIWLGVQLHISKLLNEEAMPMNVNICYVSLDNLQSVQRSVFIYTRDGLELHISNLRT